MNRDPVLDKLVQFFVTEPVCADFLAMAQETFWQDSLDWVNADDLDDLRLRLTPETWEAMQICASAFFASNDYQQHPDPRDPRWNAVACFLSSKGKTLSQEERMFAEALRKSHMSLYRVVGTETDGVVKLWDMIDAANVTAVASPDLMGQFKPKTMWGLRLLDTGRTPQILRGALPLKELTAKRVAAEMKKIHAQLMRQARSPERRDDFEGASAFEIEHLGRVMWAPEIATAFLIGVMTKGANAEVA